MLSDKIGLLAVIALTLLIGAVVAASRLPPRLKLLLYVALALRLFGACARHVVLFDLYKGSGDAVSYYDYGVKYATRLLAGDFSPFWDRTQWLSAGWRGTQFINLMSGIAVSLVGETMLGEFMLFSLLSLSGLVAFVVAYARSFPDAASYRYARWVWLFPSLWFWPSSVGKEAVTLFGFGLFTLGFVGKQGRMRYLPMLCGLFFVYAIRPQVAAVLVLAAVLTYWLSAGSGWGVGRIAQGVVILLIGLAGIWYSLRTAGVGSFDVDGVQSYIQHDAARRVGGHSRLEAVPLTPLGLVMALINVLLRPFPWEARSATMLLSSVEIWSLWLIVWVRRRHIAVALREWRGNRLVTLAFPLVGLYALTLGMMLTNLGIIARQRIFIFPFLFVLIEATPRVAFGWQKHREGIADEPSVPQVAHS